MTAYEKMLEAEQKCGNWMFRANQAQDRGDQATAEKHWARAQAWLDRMHYYEDKSRGR